jgi:aspartate 1-decarboxylase
LYRKLLRGKIHGATVTGTAVEYEGSIGIDADLLAAAGIAPLESVHVWNVTNGERFETYAIVNPAGSGAVVVNGAAAHKTRVGDKVIVAAFAWLTEKELRGHQASIVLVDGANRLQKGTRGIAASLRKHSS